MFGGGGGGSQIVPAPVPTKSSSEVQADETAERMRLAAARGRQSTILASAGEAGAPSAQRTLLGSAA
ncbi:MAG: hypothetical protein P4L83_21135 [Nevskia sp.]|nr:hypothetical protein [Nevskia sp.]